MSRIGHILLLSRTAFAALGYFTCRGWRNELELTVVDGFGWIFITENNRRNVEVLAGDTVRWERLWRALFYLSSGDEIDVNTNRRRQQYFFVFVGDWEDKDLPRNGDNRGLKSWETTGWSWHIVLTWVWAIAIVLVLLQNLLLFWDTTHHISFVELWNASTYGRYLSTYCRDLAFGVPCDARQCLRISQAVVFFDYRCGIEKWLHILRQRERAMSDALNTLIGKKGPN